MCKTSAEDDVCEPPEEVEDDGEDQFNLKKFWKFSGESQKYFFGNFSF